MMKMKKQRYNTMRKRIAYSQNFLRDSGLIAKLIESSSITKDDTVFEIGAGQGIITEQLLKRSKKVVVFEIDTNLFKKLEVKFQNNTSIEIIQGDFLTHPLPKHPYKVFSNIPFNVTSDVIKKLTQTENPPEDTYLIVQKEAAKKFVGKPYAGNNSQISVLLQPLFELEILHEFKRSDFFPRPGVDTVLLRIRKRNTPLIELKHKRKYHDFIVYTFNQSTPNIVEGLSKVFGMQTLLRLTRELGFSQNLKPSELDFTHWLDLFVFFLKNVDKKHQTIVDGSFTRQSRQQAGLEKINRTRVDKEWKRYKKD